VFGHGLACEKDCGNLAEHAALWARQHKVASAARIIHDGRGKGIWGMAEGIDQHHLRGSAARRWRYRVPVRRAAIGIFADRMEVDLRAAGVPEGVRQSLATVLDELLANVVMHAEGVRGPVHVRLRCGDDELVARLRYCAAAFDPTEIGVAELPTTIAAANIGGVGIAMVRAMTREFVHQYRRGENHLRLRLAV